MKPATGAIVLGYGSIGRRFCEVLHERGLALSIVNRRPAVRQEAALQFPEARVAADLEGLDGVVEWSTCVGVIATWGPSHAALFHGLADRGVRRILCEKPLANSVELAFGMVDRARRDGIVLAAHHDLRYAGLVAAVRRLLVTYALGEPVALVVHGGAAGLVTNGIHWIDFATALFEEPPRSVTSSAVGEYINPRSPELLFEGGTAVWEFGGSREAVVSFTNRSSISYQAVVVTRDATMQIAYRGQGRDLAIEASVRKAQAGGPPSSRVMVHAGTDELLFQGRPPGAGSFYEGLRAATIDVADGSGALCPGLAGAEAAAACIGALLAGRERRTVQLPIAPASAEGREEWQIS